MVANLPYGEIWQAEDLTAAGHPNVSILILTPMLTRQEGFIETLRQELILLRKVTHKHALDIYGLFSYQNAYFIAFEYVDGMRLTDLINDQQLKHLTPSQKQGLVVQTGKALEAYHSKMHKAFQTLGPDLIFLNRNQGVKLLLINWKALANPYKDFLPEVPLYTQYQAAEGFQSTASNIQSDVFALAALTYEIYAQKPLFRLEDDERARYQREPKAPPILNEAQWKYLQASLVPEADDRHTGTLPLLFDLYEVSQTPDSSESTPDATLSSLDENEHSPPPNEPLQPLLIGKKKRAHSFALKPWIKGLFLLTVGGVGGFMLGLFINVSDLNRLQNEISQLKELLSSQNAVPQTQNDANEQTTQEMLPPVLELEAERASLDSPSVQVSEGILQDRVSDTDMGPEMIRIPKGIFLMGDLTSIGDDNERPVREVSILQDFALSRYEVTFAEYDLFARATGRALPDDGGWGRETRPVINVSWFDAKAYTQWLSEVTGKPYRLPSEAEWEYSARAGSSSNFWWGNQMQPGMSVCDGCGSEWDAQQTAPVGQLQANPWGLYDMNGNVEEWVEDCYSDTYAIAPNDGRPLTQPNCHFRVLRGGSWFDIDRVTRSSSRYRHPADTQDSTRGFRVALDLTP
ncbi:hypothetical protein GCM10026986_21270 [Nitrincola alkalisediminis]